MIELGIVLPVEDRLSHILSAIDAIQEELRGISEDTLANDRVRRMALERLLPDLVGIACAFHDAICRSDPIGRVTASRCLTARRQK
jgi:hypothetical protein